MGLFQQKLCSRSWSLNTYSTGLSNSFTCDHRNCCVWIETTLWFRWRNLMEDHLFNNFFLKYQLDFIIQQIKCWKMWQNVGHIWRMMGLFRQKLCSSRSRLNTYSTGLSDSSTCDHRNGCVWMGTALCLLSGNGMDLMARGDWSFLFWIDTDFMRVEDLE